MNQLENCQARYRSNTWMGRTRTDGPDEFEPTKFDCSVKYSIQSSSLQVIIMCVMTKTPGTSVLPVYTCNASCLYLSSLAYLFTSLL